MEVFDPSQCIPHEVIADDTGLQLALPDIRYSKDQIFLAKTNVRQGVWIRGEIFVLRASSHTNRGTSDTVKLLTSPR